MGCQKILESAILSSEETRISDPKQLKNQTSLLLLPTVMDLSSLPEDATHLLLIMLDTKEQSAEIWNQIHNKTFVADAKESAIPLKWTYQDKDCFGTDVYFTKSRMADNFITSDTTRILRETKVPCKFFITRIVTPWLSP